VEQVDAARHAKVEHVVDPVTDSEAVIDSTVKGTPVKETIPTVPWQHARGPRLRPESRRRRLSQEQRIRKAAHSTHGPGRNAFHSGQTDQGMSMRILRDSISRVQESYLPEYTPQPSVAVFVLLSLSCIE
jgi:hypothetical protein